MKEQYQKEMSQIHVPSELLLKTKQAMKEEEEKVSSRKPGKVISFGKVSMAAVAAVLLLVVVPVASGILQDNDVQESRKIQMQLANRNEIELQAITQEKNWFEEIVDKIKELFD